MTLNFGSLLGALVESDAPAKSSPPRPAAPAEPAAGEAGSMLDRASYRGAGTLPPAPPASVDANDEIYRQLLAKTDLAAHPVFTLLQKFLSPIAALPMDEKTKFKTALLQAQAHDGLTSQSILDAIQKMTDILANEAAKFQASLQQATVAQVQNKKDQAAAILQQIAKLQTDATRLNEEAFASQQRLQESEHRFTTAAAMRQSELAQELARYTTLLQ